MSSAVTAAVAAGCSWLGLDHLVARRYRIITDVGDILLDLPFRLDETLDGGNFTALRLEIPAGVLARTRPQPGRGDEPSTLPQRLQLTNVRVRLNGHARVRAHVIEPEQGFAMSFSPREWFPDLSQVRSLGLRFSHGDDGQVTIKFYRVALLPGFVTSVAEWPPFDFMVWARDPREPKRSSEARIVTRRLHFESDGRTLKASLEKAQPADSGRQFRFDIGMIGESRRLFLDASLVGTRAAVQWRSGQLELVIGPDVDVFVGDDNSPTPVPLHANIIAFQLSPEFFALGSREARPTSALPPRIDVHAGPVSTWLFEKVVVGADVTWPWVPIPLVEPRHSPPLTFRFDGRRSRPSHISIRSTTRGKALDIRFEETFSSLFARIDGLGPAGGRFEGGLTDARYEADNRTDVRISAGTTSAAGGLIAAEDAIVRVKDVTVPDPKRPAFSLVWSQAVPDKPRRDVDLIALADGIAWTGDLKVGSALLDGWLDLAPAMASHPAGDHRGALRKVENQERGKPAEVVWRLRDGIGALEVKTSEKAADAWRRYRLVSLAAESFRAAVQPAVPGRPDATVYLPPFTLREHPKAGSPKWDLGTPGFQGTEVWEPATRTHVDRGSQRLSGFFAGFAITCANSIVDFVNAGVRFTGRVMPLETAHWAPGRRLRGRAPYRGIQVTGVRATTAHDLFHPNHNPEWTKVKDGLTPATSKVLGAVEAALRQPSVPIALSPIGGSIDFDWESNIGVVGLSGLNLHSYLGRYQRNGAVVTGLMVPWGLRYQVVSRLFRNDKGQIEYETRWSFIQEDQVYGPADDIRIFNLRPLNPTSLYDPASRSNPAFLFKADFAFRHHDRVEYLRNHTCRGYRARQDHRSETVSLDGVPGFETPRTLFADTVIRVRSVTWYYDPTSAAGCRPAVQFASELVVTAAGNIWQAGTDGAARLDDPAVEVKASGAVNEDTGKWCRNDKSVVKYKAVALTLGEGIARIKDPLTKDFVRVQVHTTAEYRVERDLSLSDIHFLQLLLADPEPGKDVKGKLVLRYFYDSNHLEAPRFEGTVDFPDLRPLAIPVCDQQIAMKLAMQPISLTSRFTDATPPVTTLHADLGAPGVVVLKDCIFEAEGVGAPKVKFGKVSICDGLLKEIFEGIVSKLAGFTDSDFSIRPYLGGIDFKWPIALPNVPLGLGSIENLHLEFKGDLKFDFTSVGLSRGILFAVVLGKFELESLDKLQWLKARPEVIGPRMMSLTSPVSFTFVPFTVRFSGLVGFVARIKDAPKPEVELLAFACLSAEAGLALAFDVGIVTGGVSLTVCLRWCPWAYIKVSDPKNLRFQVGILQIGIILDGHACVIGLINIRLHAEIMASLALGCSHADGVLSHVEFSGYASIKIFFAKIEVHFTVNLDPVLHITGCRDPVPTAFENSSNGRALASLSDTDLLVLTRAHLEELDSCLECAS
jgi:hypothetical protein